MDDKGNKAVELSALSDELRFVLTSMGHHNLTLVEVRGDVFVFVGEQGKRLEIAMENNWVPDMAIPPARPAQDGIEPALPAAPRMGEALIGLFCGRDRREDMLAVLTDKFEDKARDHGAAQARRWYWRQVARSFGPFAWQWVRRMVELETLLKLIGF